MSQATSEDVAPPEEPSRHSGGCVTDPVADPEYANASSSDDIEETDDEASSGTNQSNVSKYKPMRNPVHVMLDVFSKINPLYYTYPRPNLAIRWKTPFATSVPREALKISEPHRTHRRHGAYCFSTEGRKETVELLAAEFKARSIYGTIIKLTFELRRPMSDEDFDNAVKWCLKVMLESGLTRIIRLFIELPNEHRFTFGSKHSVTEAAMDAEATRLADRVWAVARSLV